MLKLDLHTHSTESPDGGLDMADYEKMLNGGLDYIAVTDHNSIDYAKQIHHALGGAIIIGEEIAAREGELIGLYMKEKIPAGMSAAETASIIKRQGGLVYVPHPFESIRKGLPAAVLDSIADQIDIVEIRNGRAIFQNRGRQARAWAAARGKAMAASSDAHGVMGWGKTYSMIEAVPPTHENLAALLKSAKFHTKTVGVGILYPKLNRYKKARRA